jgi:hypothetical protein
MGEATIDHQAIREWAEARGGHPSRVKGTGGKDDAGLLRIDFGEPEENLEPISWEEFFDTFEENGLALIYQDDPDSRFSKLVRR